MICIDCLKPCWHIGCMGLSLCDNCWNFVYPDQTRPLCEFCKMFFTIFEVVEEIDSEKVWMELRS